MRNLNGQFKKGFKHTESTKQKMLGRISWNKNKKGLVKMSVDTKLQMSKKQKLAHQVNNYGFKKGYSPINKGEKMPSVSYKMKDNKNAIGNIPWNKGKKMAVRKFGLSDIQKQNLSESHIGLMKGAKHWNWKGGITSSRDKIRHTLENDKWRKLIYKRDNYTCKINDKNCKGKIEAHHILRFSEYPELRFDINNGITLCKFHHPIKKKEELGSREYFIRLIINNK